MYFTLKPGNLKEPKTTADSSRFEPEEAVNVYWHNLNNRSEPHVWAVIQDSQTKTRKLPDSNS